MSCFYKISLLLIFVLFVESCSNNDSNFDIPTTYEFENVNYNGQITRLEMLEELTNYLKSANQQGVVLDANILFNMYANENAPFESNELNEATTKQLKNKTFEPDQALFIERMNKIALASQSVVEGEGGVAGVVSTNSRSVLLDENGKELTQLIEKGLMGACFFYQISEVYLSEDRIGEAVDNTTVIEGEGTAMQHHWDEAFGYFGVPVDFPSNIENIRFWGKYANGRDVYLSCNQAIMSAYLKGREAIDRNDAATKWAQAEIIKQEIERVSAATAIHYLNAAIANYTDIAEKAHVLSEAQAFTEALKYNGDRVISSEDKQLIAELFNTSFYTMSVEAIIEIKNILSTTYEFDEFKDLL